MARSFTSYAILVACITLVWGKAHAQTERFVSLVGDDAWPGTLSQPWRHVQHALDLAGPSWTISVREGVYNEAVNFVNGGSVTGTLVLRSYPGEVAVIDGTGLNADALLTIHDCSNIEVREMEIRNNAHNDAIGVLVEGACSHIRLVGVNVHDIHFSANPNATVNANTNAQPIIVLGSSASFALNDLVVDSCEVHQSRTGFSEGLAINGNVDGFRLTADHVHHISNIGMDAIGHEGTCADPLLDQARNGIITYNHVHDCISPYATCGGIYMDGARDILIEHNTVHDGMWGIEVGCEHVGKSASGIIVRNNVVYNNLGAALMLGGYDYPGGSGKVTDSLVRHNTFYHNDTQNGYEGELTLAYTENCTLAHNILCAGNGNNVLFYLDGALPLSQGLLLDHNLWSCPGGASNAEVGYHTSSYTGFSNYQNGTGQDANSLFGDPQFVDPALPDPDLHITGISPALDAGDPIFTAAPNESDMDGEARVYGNVDIGADERYPNTTLSETLPGVPWAIGPNPSSGRFRIQEVTAPFTGSRICVTDALGRVFLFEQTTDGTLDLSAFGAGLYCVELVHEGVRVAGPVRLIVQ